MSTIRVIGFDAGPRPGLLRLTYTDQVLISADVIQCSASVAIDALRLLIGPLGTTALETYVQVELFVVGNKSGRSGAAGALTRDQVGRVIEVTQGTPNVYLARQPAVTVKAWASEKRLYAAGLIVATKGMIHARDGAKHALYCASHNAGIPDPLSRKARHQL